LKELAARRMRFGYRRLTAMLVREGMPANHKRVYRLYREEGLAMRIRQRRRIRWNGAATRPVASRPNERWSMDFVSDCVSTGKVIRMLTVVDDCTRECPAIEGVAPKDKDEIWLLKSSSSARAAQISLFPREDTVPRKS
jgi:putative transposase